VNQVADLTSRHARWWVGALACVYLATLCFNWWNDAFGPAASGVQPAWPTLEVARVAPGSAMDIAGVRPGDVIVAVDGRTVASQADWFIVRANFERDRSTPIQIRRGDRHLSSSFTITTPNWRRWTLGGIVFDIGRVVVLAIALLVAFVRPRQWSARLLGLFLGMVAVAEGFPSAGWAAALRHLPLVVSIPIALASASWLLLPVVWLWFCAGVSGRIVALRWVFVGVLAPVIVFFPLITTSAIALISAVPALAIPWPLLDSPEARFFLSTFGVVPQLFLTTWPFYRPLLHIRLMEMWLAVTVALLSTGFALLVVNTRRIRDETARQRMHALLVVLAIAWTVILHNILVRNWGNLFGATPSALFISASFAAEGIVFALLSGMVAYTVLRDHKPAPPD
jgi:hypothetical protein